LPKEGQATGGNLPNLVGGVQRMLKNSWEKKISTGLVVLLHAKFFL
jgi:hypothetical protein